MGKTSGALAGAGTGAAIGSVVPGIGTAVGAVGGAILGYLGSSDDKKPTPYQVNGNNFMYGGNMSGVGKQRVERSDTQADALRDQATGAQRRDMYNSGAQGFANTAATSANGSLSGIDQARANQLASLGRMQQGNDALSAYAGQAQGPSAAQAQLQQAANQSFAQQMAAARSGQNAGGGAAALRQAQFNQAGIMGNAGMQSAQLRAQEDQAYKAQQLQALGMAQQGYGAEAGAASGLRSGDLNAGQLQANTALQGGQLQANTALGMGSLAQQNRTQNDQYSLGLGQLAQGQDQLSAGVYGQQLQAGQAFEGMMSGNYNASQGLQNSNQNANTAGQYGMASAGFGMAGQMSDERSKKEIESLKGKLAQAYGSIPSGEPQDARRTFSARAADQGFSADTSEFDTSYGPDFGALPVRRRLDDVPLAGQRAATDSAAWRARAYGIQNPEIDGPAVDLRGAPGSSYEYRDPGAPGAAPGQHIGPMAQDLEANPATAHTVETGRDGMRRVNTGRLTLTNTSAISDQQRRLDEQQAQIDALGDSYNSTERTSLTPGEEEKFQKWAKKNNIRDVNDPRSNYDYRGYYQENPSSNIRGGRDHFPDTFKQHGHPTFSEESQYSIAPGDGGTWNGDSYVPSAAPGARVDADPRWLDRYMAMGGQ